MDWFVFSHKIGKDSRIATTIALYEAFMRDHSYPHRGEIEGADT